MKRRLLKYGADISEFQAVAERILHPLFTENGWELVDKSSSKLNESCKFASKDNYIEIGLDIDAHDTMMMSVQLWSGVKPSNYDATLVIAWYVDSKYQRDVYERLKLSKKTLEEAVEDTKFILEKYASDFLQGSTDRLRLKEKQWLDRLETFSKRREFNEKGWHAKGSELGCTLLVIVSTILAVVAIWMNND